MLEVELRVYISADIEGVNGVVDYEQTIPGRSGYQRAVDWMVQEVNAVVEGALAAGALEVVVNDAHNRMINLPVDRLHPAARLLTGPGKPFSMVEGLTGEFDAALFIGYHAKMGTPGAVHDHTFSASLFHDVRLNGISVGEFGLNAAFAGWQGVPVVLVSGDEAVCEEARSLVPEITTVAVKRGVSRYAALCLPFQESLQKLQSSARKAVKEAEQRRPFKLEAPFELVCVFQKTEQADRAQTIRSGERLGPFTLKFSHADFAVVYRTFVDMMRAAAQ